MSESGFTGLRDDGGLTVGATLAVALNPPDPPNPPNPPNPFIP
jgi:hypothetical protein